MKIVADKAIPWIRHYFSGLGQLELHAGRDIDKKAVRDADILIVRTVTRVDAGLLDGSRIGFVATATSGINHVDTGYLDAHGIAFASAAGCNARAVAEYILSSLFVLAEQNGFDLRSRRVGIVGCGNVGSTVRRFLDACGITTLVCDPPLADAGAAGDIEFRSLDEIRTADIVTLHVPLESGGRHPTANMIDGRFLDGFGDDGIIINTSRGEVLDEEALTGFLDDRACAAAVIDVWRNEPAINPELLERARIATPHIAGYSLEAKMRATRMVYDRVRGYLGEDSEMADDPALSGGESRVISLRRQEDSLEAVGLAVLAAYDVRGDSISLQGMPELGASCRRDYFDSLRNDYPLRREFPAMKTVLCSCADGTGEVLTALGFQVDIDGNDDAQA